MNPIKVLIFGTDDLFPQLKPYYDAEVEKGNMEIVDYITIHNNDVFVYKGLLDKLSRSNAPFDKIIISSQNDFMTRFKIAKSMFKLEGENKNFLIDYFIDGRIFQIPDFDFQRFCLEGKAYGSMIKSDFSDEHSAVCERIYHDEDCVVELGIKTYVMFSNIEGCGSIRVDNFSCISWGVTFEIGLNNDHNHRMVSLFALEKLDWPVSKKDFFVDEKTKGKIHIGSDVWIGRGCRLKASSPDNPLNIGNGAVIASDSVVVSDVPPFAIVGGNPAKIIKYRFDEETRVALERIAWWNWDLEKIYDNFHLFKNPKDFVSQFYPQG